MKLLNILKSFLAEGEIKIKKEDEDRIELSIFLEKQKIGKIILVQTTPEFEFLNDITDEELDTLGLDPYDVIGKIEHLEIDKKYRGQGYAKQLVKKAIDLAKKLNWTPIYLNASPMGYEGLNTSDLTNFYEEFGFKVFKRQGNNNLMIKQKV